MFEIDVQNEQGYPVDEGRLQAAVAAVLQAHAVEPGTAVSVVIADDESAAALNRQFRGVDTPTDVLSFPADAPPVQIPGDAPYLGDLVIAYPYSSAQAAALGHDAGDNLALLAIHGTLHLLGYDHDTDERRAAMWAAQAKALRQLKIPADIVPALEGDRQDAH